MFINKIRVLFPPKNGVIGFVFFCVLVNSICVGSSYGVGKKSTLKPKYQGESRSGSDSVEAAINLQLSDNNPPGQVLKKEEVRNTTISNETDSKGDAVETLTSQRPSKAGDQGGVLKGDGELNSEIPNESNAHSKSQNSSLDSSSMQCSHCNDLGISQKHYAWPWSQLVMPLIVFLGIIVNSFIYYLTVMDKRKERQKNAIDDYWFRQVIAPDIKDAAAKIEKEHREYWLELSKKTNHKKVGDSFKNYLEDVLQDDFHRFGLKLSSLNLVDNSFNERINNLLDNLEEEIVVKCFEFESADNRALQNQTASEILYKFDHFVLDIMSILMSEHLKYNHKNK